MTLLKIMDLSLCSEVRYFGRSSQQPAVGIINGVILRKPTSRENICRLWAVSNCRRFELGWVRVVFGIWKFTICKARYHDAREEDRFADKVSIVPRQNNVTICESFFASELLRVSPAVMLSILFVSWWLVISCENKWVSFRFLRKAARNRL